ncbi:dienelactone hydrolase family protein [Prosthecodimorpha staleyi]|uniref:Dienelactone hydrolase family protein n=1 Tax=Prosthecodimorpha staleyi TaxID=2840188 RepID=A0A947CZ32_9HYPH|nr:dienelactone hydrolase family protein [Prosthecodimorpha staleyi]MBT9287938.1 dienelactone hydrolase family protein [Prosthecodimorpha staleyi]
MTIPAGASGPALRAHVWSPAGPGPHPAVIALHGCSGLYDRKGRVSARHADWGERLSAAGYRVVMPDSFGSRGASGSQCRTSDRVARAGRERIGDAMTVLDHLAGRADVRRDAIFLLGWSNGGSTVLNAVGSAARAAGSPDFRAAIAFYPGCRVQAERGTWKSRTDLLILIGEADDWTPAEPCRRLAAGDPGHVTLVTYPGAYHDFDHPDLKIHSAAGLAFTGSGTGSAHTGTDPAARRDAIERAGAFLAAHRR